METFDRAQMARRFAEIMLTQANYKVSDLDGSIGWRIIAQDAFDLADAMLAEENKRKTPNE